MYKFNGKTIGKYGNRQGFPVYEERLRNHELYLGEADYGPFVLYQFRLPDELIETKHKFIEGKYSTFEDKYKKIIIQTMLDYYGVNVASAISSILYKSKQLREHMETKLMCLLPNGAELSSVINLNEEIFINCVKKEDIRNLVVGLLHEMQNEGAIEEKDDRCTRLAKSKYDTWPSAYASGAVVRCRRGEIWKKK